MQYLRKRSDVGQQRFALQPQNEKNLQGKRTKGFLRSGRKNRKRIRVRKMPQKRQSRARIKKVFAKRAASVALFQFM